MIRKIIIVVLTLAAVGMPIVFLDSYRERPGRTGWSRAIRVGVNDSYVLGTAGGHVSLHFYDTFPPPVGKDVIVPQGVSYDLWVGWLGRGTTIRGYTCHYASIDVGFLAILFATYPTLAFIRGPLRRHRRRKRGLCVTCGYDLRGSPKRCPECGTEPVKP